MDDVDRPAARRIPGGLVGMVALVVAVEAGVAGLRDDLASWTSAQFAFAADAARAEAPGCDLLCLGDSVLCNGFAPEVVGGRSGLRSYNLATIGNPPAVTHALLRRALEAGARPRAVVVDFKWGILRATYRPDLQAFAELAGLGDAAELAWTARDPAYLASFAAARVLPSARARFVIRSSIRATLDGRDGSNRRSIDLLRRNWRANRGAQVLAPNPAAWGATGFPDAGGLRPEDWSCDPVNAAYVAKFFELAERHGIRVYWLLNPVHPANQARRDRLGVDDRWTRFVRSAAARSPNVVVLDARRLGLDGTHFTDGAHPDRRGAAKLSAAVGEYLRNPAPADQWVALRATPLGPAEEARLEDLNQTAGRIAEGSRVR